VKYQVYVVCANHPAHDIGVADVVVDEAQRTWRRLGFQPRQITLGARTGQTIENSDAVSIAQERRRDVTSDEPCPSGDDGVKVSASVSVLD